MGKAGHKWSHTSHLVALTGTLGTAGGFGDANGPNTKNGAGVEMRAHRWGTAVAAASSAPLLFDDEVGDKVLGLIRNALEGLLVEVPVGCQDVVECFGVVVTQKGGEAAEAGGSEGQ